MRRNAASPAGFFPEGIAIGSGPTAYITSLANGDVYKLDLDTGTGRLLTRGPGAGAAGIALDTFGRLFVAGGQAGTAWVINPATGGVVTTYRLAAEGLVVNDFAFTRDAAWVTGSLVPVLYKLPFGRRDGLPSQADVVRVPLGGDITFQEGFNVPAQRPLHPSITAERRVHRGFHPGVVPASSDERHGTAQSRSPVPAGPAPCALCRRELSCWAGCGVPARQGVSHRELFRSG
ncbi:hypothetical protein F9278_05025 [Streptomyces phaeolivaceus]|uniref:SMP-30/Gluconolactonase/LRE-like region domain-containing protein n=1 Tax=Streptomyces phaeolivaceus TaxID=2653200 RepID=A0A5P8JXA3_9ACTN|nr:hypothetical protein [Streptomyces phaeolivaceus]QFQ95653.1 hypothetical protein F9278_05025 [Streptomyces phaeolivaceus]